MNFCSKCRMPTIKAGYCKDCDRVYQREWRLKNPEKAKDKHLKRKYGLLDEDFKRLLVEQNNRCACCGNILFRPFVDHDHATKLIRGVVCLNCNTMLGHAKDSSIRLRAGEYYLGIASLANLLNICQEIE
jgi:hypothetical protein